MDNDLLPRHWQILVELATNQSDGRFDSFVIDLPSSKGDAAARTHGAAAPVNSTGELP